MVDVTVTTAICYVEPITYHCYSSELDLHYNHETTCILWVVVHNFVNINPKKRVKGGRDTSTIMGIISKYAPFMSVELDLV